MLSSLLLLLFFFFFFFFSESIFNHGHKTNNRNKRTNKCRTARRVGATGAGSATAVGGTAAPRGGGAGSAAMTSASTARPTFASAPSAVEAAAAAAAAAGTAWSPRIGRSLAPWILTLRPRSHPLAVPLWPPVVIAPLSLLRRHGNWCRYDVGAVRPWVPLWPPSSATSNGKAETTKEAEDEAVVDAFTVVAGVRMPLLRRPRPPRRRRLLLLRRWRMRRGAFGCPTGSTRS